MSRNMHGQKRVKRNMFGQEIVKCDVYGIPIDKSLRNKSTSHDNLTSERKSCYTLRMNLY